MIDSDCNVQVPRRYKRGTPGDRILSILNSLGTNLNGIRE